jgi:uncharacterized protein GlcG (DUF336 family)/mono/diheme cytochrome c family protein
MASSKELQVRRILLGVGVGLGVVTAAMLAGSGMTPVAAQDAPGTAAYYSEKVRPIFEQKCGTCHLNGNFSGGLGLGTKADTLQGGDNGVVVVPGDPTKSLLVRVFRREKRPMPLGRNPLSDQDVATIADWVKAGAVMPPDTPQVIQAAGVRQTMSLSDAKKMVAAAEAAAEAQKEHISVCVMDTNGEIVAYARMDKTEYSQLGTSQGKARAVLLFGIPTGAIADAQRANKPVTAMITAPPIGNFGGQVTVTRGGLPITKDAKMIGAIGVGGSVSEQDEKYAQIGIKAAGLASSK